MKQTWLSAQLDCFKSSTNYLKHQVVAGNEVSHHLSKANIPIEL